MAELSNKLHVKKGDTVYDCICYTTTGEATPTTGTSAGSCWEIKNNNIVCYVGLWNIASTNNPPSGCTITPLKIKKNDIEYNVLTKVLNGYDITISKTSNQSIVFTYYDLTNAQKTVTVTNNDVTVTALAGTAYTCSVTANTGYTKGTLSGASANGYVNERMSISVSPATLASYLIKITVPTGAIITVKGIDYYKESSTSANVGENIVISYRPVDAEEFTVSELTVNGQTFASGDTFTMPANVVNITCKVDMISYMVTIEQTEDDTVTVNGNGVEINNGSVVVGKNSVIKIDYTAKSKGSYMTVSNDNGEILDGLYMFNVRSRTVPLRASASGVEKSKIKIICNDDEEYTDMSFLAKYQDSWKSSVDFTFITVYGQYGNAMFSIYPYKGTIDGVVTPNIYYTDGH